MNEKMKPNHVKKLIAYTCESQKEAAQKLGVPENDISRYITGRHKMTADRFLEWCEKLGVEDYNLFKE